MLQSEMRSKSTLFFIFISFFYTLGATFFFGITQRPTEMGLVLLSGVLCMAFANIDKIAKFKGAGFEAEMKNAIDKASATIEEVRQIGCKSAAAVLEITAAFGRWGGGTTTLRRFQIRDNLVTSLKGLGVDDEDIKEAQKGFDRWLAFDHGSKICEAAKGNWPKTEEGKYFHMYTDDYAITANEFQKFVDDNNLASKEVNKAIEDLRYFESNKKLRRPEQWARK